MNKCTRFNRSGIAGLLWVIGAFFISMSLSQAQDADQITDPSMEEASVTPQAFNPEAPVQPDESSSAETMMQPEEQTNEQIEEDVYNHEPDAEVAAAESSDTVAAQPAEQEPVNEQNETDAYEQEPAPGGLDAEPSDSVAAEPAEQEQASEQNETDAYEQELAPDGLDAESSDTVAAQPAEQEEASEQNETGAYEQEPAPQRLDAEPSDSVAAEPAEQEQADGANDAQSMQEDGEIYNPEADVTSVVEPPEIPQPAKPSMKREITLMVTCEGDGVCREQETGQPLRVLPKSFSHVYKSKKGDTDNIAIENIPGFKALYVFARDDLDQNQNSPTAPGGWYQVSYSVKGPTIGWMQARDVLEWKQALIVSYRHPGLEDMRRDPVLMFRSLDALSEVVESPVRENMMTMLYGKISKGDIPPLLASKEPERFVDIDKKFYLLPILDFKVEEIDGDEIRYLQLAAAVPRKRGTDILEDEDYWKESETDQGVSEKQAKELKIEVVFVMDMSRSMQPYIDSTRDAIKELVRSIASDDVKNNVSFGLVGYRDDTRKIAALEFTSKNLTPSLVDVDTFIKLLEEEARATSIGSMDYAEEVYAGVDTGLGSAWTEDAIKILFLVGDASAHEPDHEQSTTGKNAEVLNQAARTAGVRIFAVHLLDPKMTSDHAIAHRQYTVLSQFEGADESALVEISTDDKDGFSKIVKTSAGIIFNTIEKAGQGKLAGGDKTPATPPEPENPGSDPMKKLMDSALIEYLGKEADPPKDIVVWALDRDISNPLLNAMDVRVLLNKDQLSDLIKSIEQVIQALARAEVSQQKFFEALQSVAGQTLKQPDAIAKSGKLAQSGLLPSFIQSLPYKSEILSLSDEMYAAMTAEQRSALESNLGAKLRLYQDINEQTDGWVSLNEANEDSIKVYPLLLDSLP